MIKNGYWCNNCNGFVEINKKYFWVIVGNLILLPLLRLLDGTYIPAKKVCKICKGSVKKEKMNRVSTILPEITHNPGVVEK